MMRKKKRATRRMWKTTTLHYPIAATLNYCYSNVASTNNSTYSTTSPFSNHGNADHALNDDGSPNTTHSVNPVPVIYVTGNRSAKLQNGVLADVAPSILHIMGLEQPKEMTGKCLIMDTE